jgi:UDP-N-acetylmuramoylalanine--D-glutamate ligase
MNILDDFDIKDLKNMKVAVIGFGITGQSATRFLMQNGAKVKVFDSGLEENFDSDTIKSFRGHNIEINFDNIDFDSKRFDFLVVSPGIHLDIDVIKKAVEQNIPIFNDVTLFVHFWKKRGAKVVGITGSNGKTTTVSILNKVYEQNKKVFVGGNIGKSPLDFLSGADPIDDSCVAILELSSYQLELFDSNKNCLDLSVILNLTNNHLDRYHGDIVEYGRAKTNGINPVETTVILTAGAEGIDKYIKPILMDKEINTDNIKEVSVQKILSRFPELQNRKLIGEHNLQNISVTISIIEHLDNFLNQKLDSAVLEKIINFSGVEHRIEFVREIDGVKYINDSKSTSPDATRTALESVGVENKTILIIGGEDKDMEYGFLQNLFASKLKKAILLPGGILSKIEKVCEGAKTPTERATDLVDAVNMASKLTELGDVVLLSPGAASFTAYKNFEERGRHFKEIVGLL